MSTPPSDLIPPATPGPETPGPATPGPGTPVPAPPGTPAGSRPLAPRDEVTWSTLVHLSPLLGIATVVFFAAPIVGYLVLRDRGPFVRHHVTESLNALISYGIYLLGASIVSTIVTIVTFGIGAVSFVLLPGALSVAVVVLWVVAAVEANRGRWYRYPLVIRFVR